MRFQDDEEEKEMMNPIVRDYLLQKHGGAPASEFDQIQAKYSDENYKKAEADAEESKSGLGWAQFGASIGDAMAGRSPSETNANFSNIRKGIDEKHTGEFNKKKAGALKDLETKNVFNKSEREKSDLAKDDDINSQESNMANELANRMGYKGQRMTATQMKKSSPVMQKLYEIEQKKLDRSSLTADRNMLLGEKASQRKKEVDERNIQKLSKDVDGAQGSVNSIDEVENQLGFKLGDAKAGDNGELLVGGKELDLPGVSIPGYGRASLNQTKAQNLDAAVSTVFNSVLKDRSGQAVTNPEMARLKAEFSQGKYNTEAQMVAALQKYQRAVKNELTNREAGYEPDLVNTYADRGGRTSKSFAPKERTVWIQAPNGKTKEVPDSMQDEAIAAGGKVLSNTAGR